MKKILLICVMAISLTGCNFFPTSSTDGTVDPSIQTTAVKVRAYCEQACGFLPTISSVIQMLTAENPTVVGASAVAAAICNVIKTKPMALYDDLYTKDTCPKVNGVCVDGEKVHSGEPQSLISKCPMVNGVCVEGEHK